MQSDFHRVMEARTASAAGSPEQEEALELWSPVELNFESYSAQAWNCVLLQVSLCVCAMIVNCIECHDYKNYLCLCLQIFKAYVLAHVTPSAVRQLLASTFPGTADASASLPGKGPVDRGSCATSVSTSTAAAAAAGRTAATTAGGKSAGSIITQTANADLSAGGAAAPGMNSSICMAFPSDEVLSSSNIYSTSEASLLAWMSAHVAHSFPDTVSKKQSSVTTEHLQHTVVFADHCWHYWNQCN
jgi:hypothetical protein